MQDQEKKLIATIKENEIGLMEAQEALTHHLTQLTRLGTTLEDDVCSVLRKAIAQAEARAELRKINPLTDF